MKLAQIRFPGCCKQAKRVTLIAVALTSLCLAIAETAHSAPIAVVYSNFGAGDYHDLTHYTFAGPVTPFGAAVDAAESFVSGNNYRLKKIELAVQLFQGANVLDVALLTDNGGLPGSVIENFHFENEMPTGVGFDHITPLLTADSLLHPTLVSGATYWLAAFGSADTLGGWFANSNGAPRIGAFRSSNSNGEWAVNPKPQFAGAFRVRGCSDFSSQTSDGCLASAVPEPSSFTLVGVALLGFAATRSRKAITPTS